MESIFWNPGPFTPEQTLLAASKPTISMAMPTTKLVSRCHSKILVTKSEAFELRSPAGATEESPGSFAAINPEPATARVSQRKNVMTGPMDV